MRFANSHILLATSVIVPVLAAFLWWTWRERQRLITQFVQSRLLAVLTVGVSRRRQQLRLLLLVLAVTLTLLALARPQWGFGYQEVKQRGLDIVVAIDTSRSMLAEDLSPNRLAKAKLAATDLRRLARSDRLGLIAFAGSAFLQMPMSVDQDAFRQHLDALDTSVLPQGGTAISEAIQTARAAFKNSGQENHRAVVIFTDGEDHDGLAMEAAAAAAKDGMRLFTIGVGTLNGELLPVRDAKGRTEFIKDENGNAVKSRLNETLLQDLAKAGNGFYLQLTGAKTMETLYERGLAPLPKMDFQATLMRQYYERYQWFLGLAWILVVIELMIPDRKQPPTTLSGARPVRASLPALCWIGSLLLGLPLAGTASPSSAKKSYDQGKFKTALSEYERLLEKKPEDAPLRFNSGAAAYQSGKLDKAVEHFNAALATQDPVLQERAYYNLGNSRYRLGETVEEPQKTQELWQQAISDYGSALKLDPQDGDASANLQWVKQKLEELKQQQQQQKDQGQKDSEDKDQNKDKNKDEGKNKDSKDSEQEQQNSGSKEDQNQQKDSQKSDKDSKPEPQEDPDAKDEKKEEEKASQDSKEGKGEKEDSQPADGKAGNPGDTNAMQSAMKEGRVLQMTQQQAVQLLEALRSEERLLRPPQNQTNKTSRSTKNW